MATVALLRCTSVTLGQGWLPDPDDETNYPNAPEWARDAARRGDNPIAGDIELQAIYDAEDDGPNREWATATPFAKLEMRIENPAALRQFEPGQEYVVEVRRRMPQRARSTGE